MTHLEVEEPDLGDVLRTARKDKKISHDRLVLLFRERHGLAATRTQLIRHEKGQWPGPDYQRAYAAELDLPPDLFSRYQPAVVRSHRRLSDRLDLLEQAVAQIEQQLFGPDGQSNG